MCDNSIKTMVNGNGSQPNTVQSPDEDKPMKNSFKKVILPILISGKQTPQNQLKDGRV